MTPHSAGKTREVIVVVAEQEVGTARSSGTASARASADRGRSRSPTAKQPGEVRVQAFVVMLGA